MADKTIGVNNQTIGNVAAVDVSEITRPDGTIVERQRIVIADPDDPTGLFSLDELRFDRQFLEISMIGAIEASVNQMKTRARERNYSIDRRGGTTGRGASR